MSSLEIQQLSKSFTGVDLVNPEIIALTNINLRVDDGELAVLLGPGNCGKTSLLKILAGLEDSDNGMLRIDDCDLSEVPKAERPLVFCTPTAFPWLTVRQNVEFGLRLKNLSPTEIKDRVDYYLDLTALTGHANQLPRTLTAGMNQQVAIARSMVLSPRVLLMDEPFNALDAQTRMRLQEMLLNIWEHERCTILFSTHDIDEAILLGTNVHVMSHRPGTIRKSLPINIPHPRSYDSMATPLFISAKQQIMDMLWL